MLNRFASDIRGGVALTIGIALPVLALAAGGAVEFGAITLRKVKLQSAVDAAAMNGAAQLRLAGMLEQSVTRAAQSTIKSMLPAENGVASQTTITLLSSRSSVRVRVEQTVPGLFGLLLTMPTMKIAAEATAKLSGRSKLCLLTLEATKNKGLHLDDWSTIVASGCTVYSNSTGKKGFEAGTGARATASMFCSAGGADVKNAIIMPKPVEDCPPIEDPLGSVARPVVGACTATESKIVGSQTLYPGVYCKGLMISGSGTITMMPGVYVFDDGPLIVSGTATLRGTNVGLFFSGNAGGLRFDPATTIDLTAPRSGEMSGILMFEDRSVSDPVAPPPGPKGSPVPAPYGSQPMRQYRISSDNARNLLGTIYLPAGRLIIDGSSPVASQSAYTVIVARQLEVDSGPSVFLNSDYHSTDVPVPVGVGPTSGTVSLTQ